MRVLLLRDVQVSDAWLESMRGKPVRPDGGGPVCGTVRRAWRETRAGEPMEIWADLEVDGPWLPHLMDLGALSSDGVKQ